MSQPPPKRAAWFRHTDAASIGIEIAVSITICSLGAIWLEHNVTHWSPWTTLIGLFVGLIVAGRAVMRVARSHTAAMAAEKAEGADDGG